MPPPSISSPSANIQVHLYQAFLNHETCDVSLRCVGAGRSRHGRSAPQWTASYESHRVILTQAAYFKSLFTSGFAESSRASSSPANGNTTSSRDHASSYAELDVRLRFDDPNITRAAFELCLARLYGGGPALHLAEDLHSTVSHPLTSSFPLPPPSLFPSASSTPSTPADHHPATPRFLLSLLATATYLSMPSVASEALGLIMLSIGPWTVLRYLRFAIGEGIGLDTDKDEDYDDDIRSAVGLEHVARGLLDTELGSVNAALIIHPSAPSWASVRSQRSASSKLTATISLPSPSESGGGSNNSGVRDPDFEVIEKSQGIPSDEDDPLTTPESDAEHDEDEGTVPRYFYGALGNQIGEACACWLARWSGDILDYEEAVFSLCKGKSARSHTSSASASLHLGVYPTNIDPLWTVAGKALSSLPSITSPKGKPASLAERRPSDIVLWGIGGLSVRWIRGIVSSDTFFVPDENERYHFALRVYRLRQAMRDANYGNLPEPTLREQETEKGEWEELFRTGIYYSHMSFHDLRDLESDGFVSPETITFAHWTHSVFRNTIVSARASSHQSRTPTGLSSSISALNLGSSSSSTAIRTGNTTTPPPAQLRELGLTRTTAEIKASLEDNDPLRAAREARKTYFPVFTDGSVRFGDCLSSPDLPAKPSDYLHSPLFSIGGGTSGTHSSAPGGGRPAVGGMPASEMEFFGLGNARRTARAVLQEDPKGTAKWTEFEPFRFSTEWWGADALKDKARLYSVTQPYAGSLFNVYIQVVQKKGLQLALYLHRQSMVDPVPVASSAPGSREHPTGVGPTLPHSPSLILSPRATNAYDSNEGPMQISTRTSQLTGAVSSSPPTPTSALSRLPSIPPVGSPGASAATGAGGVGGITPSSSVSTASPLMSGSSISTTYTTYFRSASPANNLHANSYRDPRASVRAYFGIACPSASGTSMTIFKSAPDDFAVDGSWGWRSSACAEVPGDAESSETASSLASTASSATNSKKDVLAGRGAGPPKDRDSVAVRQWVRELTSVRAMIVIGAV